MKNYLLLNTLRGVKKAPGRFIAIMAIIMISCAFYSGVKAASPDMKNSAWKYYDDYKLADIQIVSTLGFNDDDINTLLEEERFENGYAGYSADLLAESKQGLSAVKVMSWDKEYPLNKLYLTEGALPENSGECVIDKYAMSPLGLNVGDKITFVSPNEDDISNKISKSTFTVVGTVMSPLYVTDDRGSTTIGTGSLDAFAYIPDEDFSYETFTDIYLSVKDASSAKPFSDEYDRIVSEAEYSAETLANKCLETRKLAIREDADKELEDARNKLADGEVKYNEGNAKYQTELKNYNDALDKLSSEKAALDDAEKECDEATEEITKKEENITLMSETVPQVDELLEKYKTAHEKVLSDEQLAQIKSIQEIYDLNKVDALISDLLAVYIITDKEKDAVSKEVAGEAIKALNTQIKEACTAALADIEAQKPVLKETKKTIEESRVLLEVGEKELKNAKHELDKAKNKLDESKAEIDDANAEIESAEADIAKLVKDSKWYVWNRDELDPRCLQYGMDADRIDSIAKVFPVFFILIAALVCCTTMSRMIEEERTETGTLRALGFGSGRIILQYVLYASIASILGSVIGNIIGFSVLPVIIFECYTSMYNYPYFEAPFMIKEAAVYIGVSLLCTTFSAIYTASSELSDVPAQLIRPKPPRSGKRIFLEKIGFIWNHMKFNSKVTFRNLIRYKRRFFMMVVGIGGCTALLLTAFGLKEAIACIADKQYDEITIYDAMAVLADDITDEEAEEIEKAIASQSMIASHTQILQEETDVSYKDNDGEGILFVTSEKDTFSDYVVLRERRNGKALKLYNTGVVVTEKLSKKLGIIEGDYIEIENFPEPVMVTGIAENYTYHYIYMTDALYKQYHDEMNSNVIIFNTSESPDADTRNSICSELVACDGIITSSFMYDGTEKFRQLVSSLNAIVLLVIVFSAALAFVILFNLANININERTRELATIKVLGFFDNEVGAYIYRENTISSVIGMVIGLFAGIILEKFVIKYAEADEVMFSPDIPSYCFGVAALMIIIFIVVVNILLNFKLRKIDMAASMKAIE